MTNGERVTVQKLYDEIIPIKETIAILVTKVDGITESVSSFCKNNKEEHKDIKDRLDDKVSSKAFGVWLASLATVITIFGVVFLR